MLPVSSLGSILETILTLIMIMIMALEGAVRELFSVSSLRHELSQSAHTHVAKAQSCANRVKHTRRLSSAICRVTRGAKGQLRLVLT